MSIRFVKNVSITTLILIAWQTVSTDGLTLNLSFFLIPNRKWQDYVYIQCEYKSTKQKINYMCMCTFSDMFLGLDGFKHVLWQFEFLNILTVYLFMPVLLPWWPSDCQFNLVSWVHLATDGNNSHISSLCTMAPTPGIGITKWKGKFVWKLKDMRLDVNLLLLIWNLTGISVAVLLRCLSNLIMIWHL